VSRHLEFRRSTLPPTCRRGAGLLPWSRRGCRPGGSSRRQAHVRAAFASRPRCQWLRGCVSRSSPQRGSEDGEPPSMVLCPPAPRRLLLHQFPQALEVIEAVVDIAAAGGLPAPGRDPTPAARPGQTAGRGRRHTPLVPQPTSNDESSAVVPQPPLRLVRDRCRLGRGPLCSGDPAPMADIGDD
jgi:hypothetical protein